MTATLDRRLVVRPVEDSAGTAPSSQAVVLSLRRTRLLTGLSDASYRLRFPLSVSVDANEAGWIAFYPDLGVYGSGANAEEALFDFQEMLVEYFEDLQTSEVPLARHLRDQLYFLETFIDRVG